MSKNLYIMLNIYLVFIGLSIIVLVDSTLNNSGPDSGQHNENRTLNQDWMMDNMATNGSTNNDLHVERARRKNCRRRCTGGKMCVQKCKSKCIKRSSHSSQMDHQMIVINRCPGKIWVGTFAPAFRPENGGFPLEQNERREFKVPFGWTGGKIWARTYCNPDGTDCATGNCPGAPYCTWPVFKDAVSLAEFGLDQNEIDYDSFDISYVDGANVKVTITPIPSSVMNWNQGKCRQLSCDFKASACTKPELIVRGKEGQYVGCKSGCSKYYVTREDFCCTGSFGRGVCQPNDYTLIFKNQCSEACSYAYDDTDTIYHCRSAESQGSSYQIEFC